MRQPMSCSHALRNGRCSRPGHADCQAQWHPQSQSSGCPKAICHSASHVDRWNRIQVVFNGGCRTRFIKRSPRSRFTAGNDVLTGTLAMVRSSQALRCSKEQTAIYTLIHQRHPMPSCRGYTPIAERTMNPVWMNFRELDQ